MEVTPPIFIDNAVDGLCHSPSVAALEDHLEAWYPNEEQFVAYDSAGRLVDLVVEERRVSGSLGAREQTVEVVTARCSLDGAVQGDTLRVVLSTYLARSGAASTTTSETTTLAERVAEVVLMPGDQPAYRRSAQGGRLERCQARRMPEAPLDDLGAGLAPAGDGWFVVNMRDAQRMTAEDAEQRPPGSDCGEVDVRDEIGLGLDLPREAVVRPGHLFTRESDAAPSIPPFPRSEMPAHPYVFH